MHGAMCVKFTLPLRGECLHTSQNQKAEEGQWPWSERVGGFGLLARRRLRKRLYCNRTWTCMWKMQLKGACGPQAKAGGPPDTGAAEGSAPPWPRWLADESRCILELWDHGAGLLQAGHSGRGLGVRDLSYWLLPWLPPSEKPLQLSGPESPCQ